MIAIAELALSVVVCGGLSPRRRLIVYVFQAQYDHNVPETHRLNWERDRSGLARSPYGYAWEKLYAAVQDLAVGTSGPRRRLIQDVFESYVRRLEPEDLPPRVRDDLRFIRARLTRDVPLGREGSASASAATLRGTEMRDLSLRIVRMYDAVARTMPSGDSATDHRDV